ncbi:MAG: glycoside hydrolase family 2 protein [Alphaproteobacteria bacterium]|nr:MAG: glycoside hydrolase family 2 protein [Alphaproteobacteria bacterium]
MSLRAIGLLLLTCFSLLGCGPEAAHQMAGRTVVPLNSDWSFQRTDGKGGLTDWQSVRLPHSPRIEPLVVNDQWQGDAWYRRSLVLEPAWKGSRLVIRFEGAMNAAILSVNGQEVARHLGGYLPFVADITDAVSFDKPNEILVQLDNRDSTVTGPKPLKTLDFNMYGGLYRTASLTVLNPVHISDEMTAGVPAGGGILVTYPLVDKTRSEVQVQSQVVNETEATAIVQVKQSLMDGSVAVATKQGPNATISPGEAVTDVQILSLDNPRLWSTREPNLYTLVTEVLVDGKLSDRRETTIGIRAFRVTKDGFWLNGEKMFLRGVNRHQEYPFVGYAIGANADWRDAVRIKEAGFDYVRLSHYPHSPAFMDAADRLGLVVLDAILGWQYMNDDPAFRAHVLQTCRDMIRRDRNHASVLAWECSLNETAMPADLVQAFDDIVHEEMPGPNVYSAGWLNAGYDIYLQARQHRLQHYEEPGVPYIVSEYGDWEYYAQNAGLNQEAWGDLKEEERTSRQLLRDGERRLLQQALNIQEAHNDNFRTPAFADGYWVMFDYNRGYADDLEASGIMSIDRLPKYAYQFFRSQRDADAHMPGLNLGPMVYIANEWTRQSPTDVRIYSNADAVELFLNGKSQGRQKPDVNTLSDHLAHPPFTFQLGRFEAGTLEAVAYLAGKEVARHSVRTPLTPVGFALSLDVAGREPEAGAGDLVFVHARLVDAYGTTVPMNDLPVEFQIKGDAELVNPVNPTTQGGIASALIRIGDKRGVIRILAETDRPNIGPAMLLEFVPN